MRRSNLGVWAGAIWLVAAALPGQAQTLDLPFHEGFEPVGGNPADCTQDNRGDWPGSSEWRACTTPFSPDCPEESYPNPASKGWGPVKFETWPDFCAGGMVFQGYRAARQPIFDPYWCAIHHDFTPPAGAGDLHAEVWQYDSVNVICACECNCDPEGPLYGYPDGRPNYQIQAWLFLTNPARGDYFILGINTYSSWTRLSWATKTDGWHATDVQRTPGYHKLEIVAHPYRGRSDDVEFFVDGAKVAAGRRVPGQQISRLRLGGDPGMITENHLTNTFQEMWYDEVNLFFVPNLCPVPRMDSDSDQDVDQADFGAFQACFTGPEGTLDEANCGCFDVDGNDHVDLEDYEYFLACATFPAAADPPPPGCDLPPP